MAAIASSPGPAPPGDVFFGISFDPTDHATRLFHRDEVERELKDPRVFSWMDIQDQDISTLNEILRRWDIDLVLVSHFDAPEVLPRIVERSDCLAFYLYEVEDPERHLDTSRGLAPLQFSRMILILGVDFAITFHRRRIAAIEHVKETCAEAFRLAGRTPGFIAFLLLQRCLYDYAHLNLANDNALDRLEEKTLNPDAAVLSGTDISVAGGNILTLKKLAASLHIVLMLLATKRNPFISNEARTSFNEMLQNALAVRAAVDSSRDLLDGILGTIQAEAAHRTSEIARVLTVMSGVLLPLTLISGIYGMNFEHMPELKWEMGYFGTLGMMAVVGLLLILVFKRLGWVGAGRTLPRRRRP